MQRSAHVSRGSVDFYRLRDSFEPRRFQPRHLSSFALLGIPLSRCYPPTIRASLPNKLTSASHERPEGATLTEISVNWSFLLFLSPCLRVCTQHATQAQSLIFSRRLTCPSSGRKNENTRLQLKPQRLSCRNNPLRLMRLCILTATFPKTLHAFALLANTRGCVKR